MAKSVLSFPPVQIALGGLLGGYMTLVARTTRWTVRDAARIAPLIEGGKGVVVCFWHGRLMMSGSLWPKSAPQKPAILISRSTEGDVIARAAAHQGGTSIRGSSRNAKKTRDKGAVSAYRAMLRHVEAGGAMGVTPDGPRGPRMRAGMGAIRLAAASGAPLIPVSWAIKHRWMAGSWDRFILPLPFSEGVITWGEPFTVPAEAGAHETSRARLEADLNALTAECDIALGLQPVEPAETT